LNNALSINYLGRFVFY